MMTKEYNWITADHVKLFAHGWIPEEPSDKIILLIHGLGEHCLRYNRWAQLFNREGYTVLSFDQRGHGRSEGKRGHARSLEVLLEDIDLLFLKSDELFPGYKKILYGHSMGGNLALNYMIRKSKPLDGLIITSPWLKLFKQPKTLTLVVSKLFNFIIPSLSLHNQLKPEQISRDPVVVRNYMNDPMVHDRISVRLFFELYNGGLYALQNVFKINCPLLLMHGGADTITSPRASRNFTMNTNNTTFKLWETQFHELHHELIYKEVFDYTKDWLDNFVVSVSS